MLRPSSVSNGAALVKRFGVVAVNSALEVELPGNINSNYIDEAHVISVSGGVKISGRSASVTVVALSSSGHGRKLSCLAPMVPTPIT
jgi:succinyl-CoA:acetate CoA-transferase